MLIAMHARLGDGSIALYNGPAGQETLKAIAAINEWCQDVCEPNPSNETQGNSESPPIECDSDEELAENLLWWANSGDEREDWVVDTGVTTKPS